MAVTFNVQQQIHGRYQMLSPPPIISSIIDPNAENPTIPFDGQQYATFMKSLTNENSWNSSEKLTRPKNKPNTIDNNSTLLIAPSKKSTNIHRKTQSTPSVLSVNELKKKNDEEHHQKLKAIEDYMLVCKQEERDLKRIEGDIIKKERNLKKTMKDYENDVYNKQRNEESQATAAMKEEEKIKQQFYVEDDKITKDRIARNIGTLQKEKETVCKSVTGMNGLEFRFENIAEAIELKRREVDALVKEFEMKLRQKEEEEHRLKKECANISLELNMEAQKNRAEVKSEMDASKRNQTKDKSIEQFTEAIKLSLALDNLRRSNELDEKIKSQKERSYNAEHSKRKKSKDLNEVKCIMSMQTREEGRRLKDIKVKLHNNTNKMKEAQIKARLLEMERQGKLSEDKVIKVNAKRKEIHDLITHQRKRKNEQETDEFRDRYFVVQHEVKKQDLKDNIQHFQKVVNHCEQTEYRLYNEVRHLDTDKRKQEQTVRTLRQQLTDTQKQNKLLIKETTLRCQQQEKELEQKLQREEAKFGKALSKREEKIQTLVKYRGSSKEDKHMLNEQKKVHDRLVRIEKKSNLLRHQQNLEQQSYESVY